MKVGTNGGAAKPAPPPKPAAKQAPKPARAARRVNADHAKQHLTRALNTNEQVPGTQTWQPLPTTPSDTLRETLRQYPQQTYDQHVFHPYQAQEFFSFDPSMKLDTSQIIDDRPGGDPLVALRNALEATRLTHKAVGPNALYRLNPLPRQYQKPRTARGD